MHADLLDTVDFAVQQKWVDRDQVAIMGVSYGGYAALAGLTLTPDVFACGIDQVGPSNLKRWIDYRSGNKCVHVGPIHLN